MTTTCHYSLVDPDGNFIGNLHELDLAVCPQVGHEITFAADGQDAEITYVIERIRHIIHKNLSGDLTQAIDLHVRPAVTIN